MGNNDSKVSLHNGDRICNTRDEEKRCYLSTLYKSFTADGDEKLTADNFMKIFFPDDLYLSDLVFNHILLLSGNKQTGEHDTVREITEQEFIKYAGDLMELNSCTEQVKFYFQMFADNEDKLSHEMCRSLLCSCFNAALTLCSCPTESADNVTIQPIITAVIKAMFGREVNITESKFCSWVNKHSSGMVESLHRLLCQRLGNKHKQSEAWSLPNLYNSLHENKFLLSLYSGWLLSCQLSHVYIPTNQSDSLAVTSPFYNILQDGWHLLYDSNSQGLSVNRFQHHVFQYKAPTISLVTFEGHIYCLAVQDEWKEDVKSWGGSDCCLVQISPEFKVVQSGLDLVFLNFSLRSLPKGIQIGTDNRTRVLEIEEDLHKVKHFGISTPLHRLEVWGCGGDKVRDAQRKQKDWEKKDAMKQKDRKLKIDVNDWKNSPDRQILEMGGVTTEHAER